ncbi:MAG: aspartate aminotransferase family protein [Candidatus Hydrogenedens sp.]|nr:aspartate aminotransferase family protein [Candidatus Hydrogenedens sp.]
MTDIRDHGMLLSEGDINLSPSRREWADRHIGPETREMLGRDEAVFLHQSLSTPCLNVLRGCGGVYLEDAEGRRIMDFHGNYLHQAGYGHPKVIEAVVRQMGEMPFCPRRYTNATAVELARRLVDAAPGDLSRVLFAPGGTAAVGMAMKLARAATGRHVMLSMWDSFHGASLDAVSIGGEAIFRAGMGPLLPGCEHVPPPDPSGSPFAGPDSADRCADYIEYVLEKQGDVCAVVAETVRCSPYAPPLSFWRRVRESCDRHGALLILDEISTALGRTGHFYAVEPYGIVPDMIVLGKGLGGGIFPLAALLAREGLNSAMPDRALGHYTHEKNPVACAAGLATVSLLLDDGLLEHARRMAGQARDSLEALRKRHPMTGPIRGVGLLLGLELLEPGTGRRATEAAEMVMYAALERGLSFKISMGNILTLVPPLVITQEEWDRAVAILDECLTLAEAAG